MTDVQNGVPVTSDPIVSAEKPLPGWRIIYYIASAMCGLLIIAPIITGGLWLGYRKDAVLGKIHRLAFILSLISVVLTVVTIVSLGMAANHALNSVNHSVSQPTNNTTSLPATIPTDASPTVVAGAEPKWFGLDSSQINDLYVKLPNIPTTASQNDDDVSLLSFVLTSWAQECSTGNTLYMGGIARGVQQQSFKMLTDCSHGSPTSASVPLANVDKYAAPSPYRVLKNFDLIFKDGHHLHVSNMSLEVEHGIWYILIPDLQF